MLPLVPMAASAAERRAEMEAAASAAAEVVKKERRESEFMRGAYRGVVFSPRPEHDSTRRGDFVDGAKL